ncbi:MAG: hypothetical protein ACOC6C_02265 [Verrucomicrobiota bacterium]
MNSESRFKKIAVLESEVQARFLEESLKTENIPHIMKSYHENAFDGLFSLQKGWGHVEAPEQYKKRILSIIQEGQSDEQ